MHATTVATNAVIEGKTASTGFVTTEGFRDMLEVARQVRPSLYDLQFEKPRPLVPRDRCFGVPERLGPGGEVIRPLDEDAVRAVAFRLREEGVAAIALCFLHSYVNPTHERRAADSRSFGTVSDSLMFPTEARCLAITPIIAAAFGR